MRELLLILCLALTPAAFALISSGWEAPIVEADDPDYAAGLDAFVQEDWQGVIRHMGKALTRRPENDNAQNLLAIAYQKLGHNEQAADHYGLLPGAHTRQHPALEPVDVT